MSGKYIRIDRRYRNPYRLTGRGFLWFIGIVVWLVFSSMNGYIFTLGLLVLLALAGRAAWIGYQQHQLEHQAQAQALTWQTYIASQDSGYAAPTGARNSRVIPQDARIAVSVRDQGRCRQCGSAENLHFDHVVPYSRGGSNTVDNIQLLCANCNLAKGARES